MVAKPKACKAGTSETQKVKVLRAPRKIKFGSDFRVKLIDLLGAIVKFRYNNLGEITQFDSFDDVRTLHISRGIMHRCIFFLVVKSYHYNT